MPRDSIELGVRSMLSGRLFLSDTQRGSLNLYADRPHAFDEESIPLVAIFASYASLTLINHLHRHQHASEMRAGKQPRGRGRNGHRDGS